MNKKTRRYTPYSKRRDITQSYKTKKSILSVRLSEELLMDYNGHFKSAYPEFVYGNNKLNNNKVLTTLILDYINQQCLERKQFDIDILIAVNQNNSSYKLIAVKNDYILNRSKVDTNERAARADTYLTDIEKYNSHEVYKHILERKYFNILKINKEIDSYSDFENALKTELQINPNEYNYFLIRVNNYLDEFITGNYQSFKEDWKDIINPEKRNPYDVTKYAFTYSDNLIHRGIGQTDNLFFTYVWQYTLHLDNENEQFKLLEFRIIDKEEFEKIIKSSTNISLRFHYGIRRKNEKMIQAIQDFQKEVSKERKTINSYANEIHGLQ